MCEGGDENVPKQCWLGGKCQKVSKSGFTYWCQSPVIFANKRDILHDASAQGDSHELPHSDEDIPLNPNIGRIGPLMTIQPKINPAPTSVPAHPPVQAPPPVPTQDTECRKCNDELAKCTTTALCDYKQPGQDYCVDGCKRYVCNFARPKVSPDSLVIGKQTDTFECRDTCFKDECTRLNAVWKGSEYNGF